jgi:hypothetical protein
MCSRCARCAAASIGRSSVRILPASARQGRASRAEGQQAPLIDRSLAERVRAPAAVAVERPVELRVASTLVDGRADVILDEPNDVIPDEPNAVARRVSLLSGVIRDNGLPRRNMSRESRGGRCHSPFRPVG